MEDMKKIREEIIRKWEKSGLLDGIVGPLNENIAKQFECCKSSKLVEGEYPIPLAKQVLDNWK